MGILCDFRLTICITLQCKESAHHQVQNIPRPCISFPNVLLYNYLFKWISHASSITKANTVDVIANRIFEHSYVKKCLFVCARMTTIL